MDREISSVEISTFKQDVHVLLMKSSKCKLYLLLYNSYKRYHVFAAIKVIIHPYRLKIII